MPSSGSLSSAEIVERRRFVSLFGSLLRSRTTRQEQESKTYFNHSTGRGAVQNIMTHIRDAPYKVFDFVKVEEMNEEMMKKKVGYDRHGRVIHMAEAKKKSSQSARALQNHLAIMVLTY